MTRKERLTINPFLIGQMNNLTEEEIIIAIKATNDLSMFYVHENKGKFMESVLQIKDDANRNKVILITLSIDPWYIKFIPKTIQTVEMCEMVYREENLEDYHNYMLLNYCEKQSKKMCLSIPDDILPAVFSRLHYIDEYMVYIAVKRDGRNLKDVPENLQTKELVKLAVDNWAKSIRWSKLSNIQEQEEVQIYAINKNLQSYTCFTPVTQKVIDIYRELCVRDSYFPDVLEIAKSIPQEELYKMLIERHMWIEAWTIFNLLNDEYKQKFLNSEYINKVNCSKVNLDEVKDYELKLKLITLGVEYDYKKLTDKDIEYCIKFKPEFIHKIGNLLADEMLLKLVKYTKDAIEYLKSYKDEYLQII